MHYEQFYSSHLELIRTAGPQAYGKCPFHIDKVKSFSVNMFTSQWMCHAGCGAGNATTFARRLGIEPPSSDESVVPSSSFRPHPPTTPTRNASDKTNTREGSESGRAPRRIVDTYTYEYEDGHPAFRVFRFDPKGFSQQRFEGGEWKPGTAGIRRVIYRLPKILEANPPIFIFLVEGEKDVHRLENLGLVATTSPMGSNSWNKEFSHFFKGKRVAIIPDNDPPGEDYARRAAGDIADAGGKVKIVRLPNLPDKGDVSDYLDNVEGDGRKELLDLVDKAPLFGTVRHTNEDPMAYFARYNIAVHDGALLLPHEFKRYCEESFREFTRRARGINNEVQANLKEAEDIWKKCRTIGQYRQFLRLLKRAHEFSEAER